MARPKTAQPNHSLRKIAVVVATAVSGMSVYAQAAVEPKEETITVTAAPAPQESAWGPAATIAARQSATGTKTDTPIQKVPQSISVVTAEEMALHQPKSVKEALSYTPGVAVGTRGASNTYDYLIIRGFAADGQSQNNFLNGLKMQGNFYNDAVIDPYAGACGSHARSDFCTLRKEQSGWFAEYGQQTSYNGAAKRSPV